MLAKQYSKQKEMFCTAETPLTEVYRIMMETNCDCMPIVESLRHRDIIGTITEHDICQKTITFGLNPQQIKAGRVMNGDFISINSKASVAQCLELFLFTGAERIYLVNDICGFEGILTKNDLPTVKPRTKLKTIVRNMSKSTALPQNYRAVH